MIIQGLISKKSSKQKKKVHFFGLLSFGPQMGGPLTKSIDLEDVYMYVFDISRVQFYFIAFFSFLF